MFLALFKVGQVLLGVLLPIGQYGLLNLLEQRVFLTLFKVGKVLPCYSSIRSVWTVYSTGAECISPLFNVNVNCLSLLK